MDEGDKADAIADYRKSLLLNPSNGNAVRMLHKLGAEGSTPSGPATAAP
jgi:hypothetical protein